MPLTRSFSRWFPVPQLLVPHGAGIDVSDSSVKWLSLGNHASGTITNFGEIDLSPGVVVNGSVREAHALGLALAEIKKKTKITHAHVALPEEGAYVFSMYVPLRSTRDQIMTMIEFELENRVPIPHSQAVYDYDLVERETEHDEIAVTVFPRELADGYVEAFRESGITLLSLEIEARSIARAVSGPLDPVTLMVDCGRARTGVAILKRGVPIFTSTVDVGGDNFTKVVTEALGLKSEEEAKEFKNEHGLLNDDPALAKGYEAVEKVAASLAGEIAKHYRFWDTRRSEEARTAPVERVYILGGSANLRGLSEYIAGKVQAETVRPNVWRNVLSFNEHIPPIEYRTSFQYATAIGLALRSS